MVRLEGPAVESLAITFLADWYVESEDELEQLRDTGGAAPQPCVGECAVQALPSGPAYRSESIEQILIMAIYVARRELILTTPYFVPSESLRMALESAARRGVKVILIIPAKVDSLLVRYASQAFQGDLLKAGRTHRQVRWRFAPHEKRHRRWQAQPVRLAESRPAQLPAQFRDFAGLVRSSVH